MTKAVPALTSPVSTTLAGQVIPTAPVVPEKLTTTLKLQESPDGAVQVTVVEPMAKVEPDGGLQTAPAPPSGLEQLPDSVAAPYVTTALHWLVLTGAADGQLIEHPGFEPKRVVGPRDLLPAGVRCGAGHSCGVRLIVPFATPLFCESK